MSDDKAIVPHEEPEITAVVDADEFKVALAEEKQKRDLLEAYIREELKRGVDWDVISINTKRGSIQSKPTLLKPGSEKILNRLRLRARFAQDTETLQMLGEDADGVVAYKCELIAPTGAFMGEGRGACGRERMDVNTRIKIAEKRAMLDATLRVAALSDQFTQDLDDMPERSAASPKQQPPAAPRPEGTINEKQQRLLGVRSAEKAKQFEAVSASDVLRPILTELGVEKRAELKWSQMDKALEMIEQWEPPNG